jgi:hypothetical protein
MPVIYSVGDNEWTDCLRVNNGAYAPLERLALIRRTFFATNESSTTTWNTRAYRARPIRLVRQKNSWVDSGSGNLPSE